MKIPLLFICCDAGETHALLPVLDRLDEQHMDYRVLVMGTARTILEGRDKLVDINAEGMIATRIGADNWGHEDALNDDEIEKITTVLQPQGVVTGVDTRVQHQIADAFQAQGLPVIAYLECFMLAGDMTSIAAFLKRSCQAWVASSKVAEKLDLVDKAKIVGHPDIDAWQQLAGEPINNNPKVILYAGGYGAGYEESFKLFVSSLPKLSDYTIKLALHPKVDGQLEKQLLGKADVKIYPPSYSILTACQQADLIVSHASTVGVKALFMGKPTLYLNAQADNHTNIALVNNWTQQFESTDAFVTRAKEILNAPNACVPNISEMAGIPPGGCDRIVNELRQKFFA